MYTKARTIQKVAIEDAPPLMADALAQAGLSLEDIDYLIPHQTSARAIRKGVEEFSARLGAMPKHVVNNVEQYGNTSSTTHFVALYRYLQEGRFRPGARVMLLSLASGLEIGVILLEMDELVERYGRRREIGGDSVADNVPPVASGAPTG
jgi:3-oxoacyl-[acyl-carrier-protein] synthase-3